VEAGLTKVVVPSCDADELAGENQMGAAIKGCVEQDTAALPSSFVRERNQNGIN